MLTMYLPRFILFCLLVTVYTLTNSGGFHIIDEVSLFAVTESLSQRGAVDTNAIAWTQWVNSPGEVLGSFGPDGQVYSKKGPGPAFVSLPWYLLLLGLVKVGLPVGLLQGALLWNGFITAGTAILLWATATRLGYRERTGLTLALLFGLGTIAWPYANHLFGEPLSAFAILLMVYGVSGERGLGIGDRGLGIGDRGLGTGERRSGTGKRGLGTGERNTPNTPIPNTQYPNHPIPQSSNLLLIGIGGALAILTVTAHALLVAVVVVYWGLGIRDWGLGIGDRGLGTGDRGASDASPIPQSLNTPIHNTPIPNTQSPNLPISNLALLLLPLLLALLALALYNAVRFGSPLDTGYHFDSGEGFTTPIWEGLWGLIFSPYRGLFWHTPLLILSVIAFPAFVRRHRGVGWLIAGLSVVIVGLYSVWWMWWGGFAWGPRFLVPMTPVWVLVMAPLVEAKERMKNKEWVGKQTPLNQGFRGLPILYSSFFIPSFLVQISAVTVNYVNYEIQLRDIFPTDWADPLRFGPPAQGMGDWLYSPVVGQWRLMAQDFVANTDLAWLWADGTVLWPVVGVGIVSVGVLAWLLVGEIGRLGERGRGRLGRGVVAGMLPLLVMAVWLPSVGTNPHYGQPGEGYRAILDEIRSQANPDDALITITPFHYQIPMNWLDAGLPIYGYATGSADHPETVALLSAVLGQHGQIWYVTGGLAPSDPGNTVERWLADRAFKADDRWFGDFRLVRYGGDWGLEIGDWEIGRLGEWESGGGRVVVSGVGFPGAIEAGRVLPVVIGFVVEEAGDPLRWFVQLLGPEGAPVAQLDTAPLDGYASFDALPQGQPLTERAGLHLPPDLPPGTYRLIAGLYNPAAEGAPRLRTEAGADFLELGTVSVEARP